MNEQHERPFEMPPTPAWGDEHLNDLVDQHLLNAHRLRAETFERHAIAVGNLIRPLGRPVLRVQAAVTNWFRHRLKTYSHRQSEIGTHG